MAFKICLSMPFRRLECATRVVAAAGAPYGSAFGREYDFLCELLLLFSAVLNALEKPRQAIVSRACKITLFRAQKDIDVCNMPLYLNRPGLSCFASNSEGDTRAERFLSFD